VNDPLRYKGVTFYQSSYGLMESLSGGVAVLTMKSPAGESASARLKVGESVRMPGSGQTLSVTDFSPSLAFDPSGRPYTYSEMMNNPAIKVQISGVQASGQGGNQGAWILKRYPETWRMPDGGIVEFADFWGISYTGLQARRDPGVWIVYLGCAGLAAGLCIAFFMSHRKLWVRAVQDKDVKGGGTRVLIAATASKNKHAFERQVEKMSSLLGEGGK
jgi:cytochrome c biogenesis protein